MRRCVTHNEHVWESRTGFWAGLKWLGEQGRTIGCDFDGGWTLSWGSPCIVWASHQSPGRQHLAFLPACPDMCQKGNKERWGFKAIRSLTSTMEAALYYSPSLWPPLCTTRFYIKSLFIWLLFLRLGYKVCFVCHPMSRAENSAEQQKALNSYLLKGCWGVDGFLLLRTGVSLTSHLWCSSQLWLSSHWLDSLFWLWIHLPWHRCQSSIGSPKIWRNDSSWILAIRLSIF